MIEMLDGFCVGMALVFGFKEAVRTIQSEYIPKWFLLIDGVFIAIPVLAALYHTGILK